MVLISACLIGLNCKYNGGNNFREKALDLVKNGDAIPICPEQLGGLTTPRDAAEIKTIDGKKRVINNKKFFDEWRIDYENKTNIINNICYFNSNYNWSIIVKNG